MQNRDLIILYGSQTGNAQDLAERVWRQSRQYNLKNTRIYNIDEYDLTNLQQQSISASVVHLIVCSTTGQGDVPDNMLKFWKLIMRRNIPINALDCFKFSIIGLGDSAYAKYNFIAKKLFKRFIQLGAECLVDICLCDEQQGNYEHMLSKWLNEFWYAACKVDIESVPKSQQLPYLYEVEETCSKMAVPEPGSLYNETNPYYCKVLQNKRVTSAAHWQDTRLIEFECDLKYEPGDVLMVKPQNSPKNIKLFYDVFQHLNLKPSQRVIVKSNSPGYGLKQFESIHTIGGLVEKYFDFNSVPRLSFFHTFARYSYVNETENEKLIEFLSTSEGLEDLYEYCHRPRRSLIEVFNDFPHTTQNIKSLNDLINLIPEIKPRSFSIASNYTAHTNCIQILVAIVEYKTRLFEPRRGTCSSWLASLQPNDESRAPIWLKTGTFNINLTQNRPVICIGPGTGVAPFRSIIYENICKYNFSQNYLYFGCRSKQQDFYFEDEWNELSAKGQLTVYTAFSRDQDAKIYVQDKILQNSSEIFNLIYNLNAIVLVAGSSKRMPDDVQEAIRKSLEIEYEKFMNFDKTFDYKEFSENYMKQLEASKRLQLETWS